MSALGGVSRGATAPQVVGLDGIDHRTEWEDVTNPILLGQAQAVGCLMDSCDLELRGLDYHLPSRVLTLGAGYGLALGERFYDQPIAGRGTVFVIGKRWVVTAGHCLFSGKERLKPEQLKVVFDFVLRGGVVKREFEGNTVYGITRFVALRNQYKGEESSRNEDWALVELDRDVEGVVPLGSNFIDKVNSGARVHMWGHPSGLPMKLTDHAEIQKSKGSHLKTNLNSFRGNSGSPVFDSTTNAVCGILVRGPVDVATQSDYTGWYGDRRVLRTDSPSSLQAMRHLTTIQSYLKAIGEIGGLKGKKLAKEQILVAGWIHREENGMTGGSKYAAELLREAADLKYKKAQYRLGKWLYEGVYVGKDKEEGKRLLKRSAHQGDEKAVNFLARLKEKKAPPVAPAEPSVLCSVLTQAIQMGTDAMIAVDQMQEGLISRAADIFRSASKE